MAKKDIIALVAVALVIVIIFAFVFFWGHGAESPTNVSSINSNDTTTTSASASQTRAPAPQDLVVPNEGSSSSSAPEVAIPETQTVASPTGKTTYRSFSITAENNLFTPNTVIVNVGDSVDMAITAVGATYDFTQPDYGFHVTLPEGKVTKVDFQATAAGRFTFYCSSCGGPIKGPVGYIEVVSPQ